MGTMDSSAETERGVYTWVWLHTPCKLASIRLRYVGLQVNGIEVKGRII